MIIRRLKSVHQPSIVFGAVRLDYLYRGSGVFIGQRNELRGREHTRKQNEGFGTVMGAKQGQGGNRLVRQVSIVTDRDLIDVEIR